MADVYLPVELKRRVLDFHITRKIIGKDEVNEPEEMAVIGDSETSRAILKAHPILAELHGSALIRGPTVRKKVGERQAVYEKGARKGTPRRKADGTALMKPVYKMVDHPEVKGKMRIDQHLYMEDIDDGLDKLILHLNDSAFWKRIKVLRIDLRPGERSRGHRWPRCWRNDYAHQLFEALYDIFNRICFTDENGSPVARKNANSGLRLLEVKLYGAAIRSMDAPGMFWLAQLPCDNIRFIGPYAGSPLSRYISNDVRRVIEQRTKRTRNFLWHPTGLENPCPRVDWIVQALGEKEYGVEEKNIKLKNFLIQKYESLYSRRRDQPGRRCKGKR